MSEDDPDSDEQKDAFDKPTELVMVRTDLA